MTPEEQQTLRISTERGIDQIVRACWPREWSSEPAPDEPRMVIGCIHPIQLLKISTVHGHVYCEACGNAINQEAVVVRWDTFNRNRM